jgi:hypothetical protein
MPPVPPATHKEPFHATAIHASVIIEIPFVDVFQDIPSYEYANVLPGATTELVKEPFPATHKRPFHATAEHWTVKIELPLVDAVQVIPSKE